MSTPIAPVQQTYPAPNRNQFVAEGTYILATNPTVSTGLTWVAAQTSFSDTAPNFFIHNSEPAGGRTLYLDYLKMVSTAVGTGAVSWQYAVILDPIPRTFATDNTLLIVPQCPASSYSIIASPTIKAQNSATTSALSASSTSKKLVARGCLGGVNIAGHVYGIVFGDCSAGVTAVGSTDTAAAPGRSFDFSGPVAINPGQDCTIYIWGPSSSAAFNPEFELGMVARP
jgi:hypothetical protein